MSSASAILTNALLAFAGRIGVELRGKIPLGLLVKKLLEKHPGVSRIIVKGVSCQEPDAYIVRRRQGVG